MQFNMKFIFNNYAKNLCLFDEWLNIVQSLYFIKIYIIIFFFYFGISVLILR